MVDKSEDPQPMDPNAREGEAAMHINQPRMTYGMETLVEEVMALFPETSYEVSNRNPRNVAFDVQFDLASLGERAGDALLLFLLLVDPAYNEDSRIKDVVSDEGTYVLVSFVNDPRVMDSREPYGLAEAWLVLNEGGAL